jgi:hypothetical protein
MRKDELLELLAIYPNDSKISVRQTGDQTRLVIQAKGFKRREIVMDVIDEPK